ncbi:MAG: sulfotransferase [Hyphomonas sp.]|nr:sulfotransferase [Hyphomonas sp.]
MNNEIIAELERAYSLQTAGQLAQAESIYLAVLDQDPNNIHALNLLGVVYLLTERPAEATETIARAVAIAPDDPEARTNLGLAHKDMGNLESAENSFRAAIESQPTAPRLNNLGNVLLEQGRPADAVNALKHAIQLSPRQADPHVNIARAFMQLKKFALAERAISNALKLDSSIPEAHSVLADLLSKRCEYSRAEAAYRVALRLAPDRENDIINLAYVLKDLGEVESAIKTLDQLGSRHARGLYARGQILEQSGDARGAEHAFHGAITQNPKFAAAYYQLAQLKGRPLKETEVSAMRTILNDPTASDDQKHHSAFGLALFHEQVGDFEQALEYFDQGHRHIAPSGPYVDEETSAYHARIRNVGCRGARGSRQPPQPRPLFVLGMPRSGTSLTEQVLSSHPLIAGSGESSFLEDAVGQAKLITGKPFPECQLDLSEEQASEIGALYRARLTRDHPKVRFVVDKTPLNFQYIGFASRILPDAKFLHCTRNPADTCISIYRLPFDAHQTYAHRLDSLAQFYRRYHALMSFWHKEEGLSIKAVRYEALVENLEAVSAGLLEHLGLEFHPDVLAFHTKRGVVRTPSASQVRQPIYRDSVDRWKRYGTGTDILTPLLSLSTFSDDD